MTDTPSDPRRDPGMRTRRGASAGLMAPAAPARVRRPLAAVAAGAAAGVTALGVAVSGGRTASPIDDALLTAAGGASSDGRTTGLIIDFFGEPAGVLLLGALLVGICVLANRWRLALLTVAAQGVIGALGLLLKPLVDRQIHGSFLAYPSGHAAGAAAFAMVIGLLLSGLRDRGPWAGMLIVIGITTAVGLVAAWAQTILAAHYASDAIGGFLLALAVVPLLALVIDAVADRLLSAVRDS